MSACIFLKDTVLLLTVLIIFSLYKRGRGIFM